MATLAAKVFPPSPEDVTEIVLEGRCPRCLHQTVSTHPIRTVISETRARALAAAEGLAPRDGFRIRRVAGECCCRHPHPEAPEGATGCGAPFALWVHWSGKQEGVPREVVVEAADGPTPLELQDERELRATALTELTDVHKAAESWRNGLAGFVAILLAAFFVKGKSSFDDIGGSGWKAALAVLLLVAGGLAVFGAYRAIRAAYGTPRDAQLGEIGPLMVHLYETTPRYIYKYGTLSAWRHALTRQAVKDLRWAKGASVGSVVAIAAAAAITWLAPGPPTHPSVQATYRNGSGTATVCGEAKASPAGTLTIKPGDAAPQTFTTGRLVSLALVEKCP